MSYDSMYELRHMELLERIAVALETIAGDITERRERELAAHPEIAMPHDDWPCIECGATGFRLTGGLCDGCHAASASAVHAVTP